MLYVVEKEDRARPRPLAARTALPDRALPVPAQAPQGPSQTCIGTWQLRSMGSQAISARVWVCVLLLLLLWSFFFPQESWLQVRKNKTPLLSLVSSSSLPALSVLPLTLPSAGKFA